MNHGFKKDMLREHTKDICHSLAVLTHPLEKELPIGRCLNVDPLPDQTHQIGDVKVLFRADDVLNDFT